MSIEKKSLISTLKTTKKANVAKGDLSHAGSQTSSVKSAAKVSSAARAASERVKLAGDKKMAGVKFLR